MATAQTTDTPEETNVCSSPVPPPRPPTTSVSTPTVPIVPTAYNDKVVAFLRQPNIFDILCERRPTIKSNASVRDKVHTIRANGTPALDRFSDDIELTIILSLFEQEIMSYVPTNDHLRQLTSSSPQASPVIQRSQVFDWSNPFRALKLPLHPKNYPLSFKNLPLPLENYTLPRKYYPLLAENSLYILNTTFYFLKTTLTP